MTEQIKVLLADDDDRNIFALSAYLKAKKILFMKLFKIKIVFFVYLKKFIA